MTNTPTPPTDAAQEELWICRRKIHVPEYDGGTGYFYYEAVEPYTPAQPVTDKERAEALLEQARQTVKRQVMSEREGENITSEIMNMRLSAPQSTQIGTTEGHDVNCCFCGEKTNDLAGNPAKWSTWFPENGQPRYCHAGCLKEKLDMRVAGEKVRELLAELARDDHDVAEMSDFVKTSYILDGKEMAKQALALLDQQAEQTDHFRDLTKMVSNSTGLTEVAE